jgi:hypothetical protein
MNQGRPKSAGNLSRSRSTRLRGAIVALAAVSLMLGTACDEEEAFSVFRGAAASSIQDGVKSIMDGMVDGMFAVLEQGTDTATTSGE